MRHFSALCAALAVCAFVFEAHAEEPQTNTRASRAQELFEAGQKALQGGRIPEACNDFAESQRIEPALGTLLNLAFCHEHEGRTATAWVEFKEAADQAAASHQESRTRFALEHAGALEGKLGRLRIALPRGQTVRDLKIDGQPIAPQEPPVVAVDPGPHLLAATLADGQLWQQAFTVQDRATLELVAPAPEVGAVPQPASVPNANDSAPALPAPAPAADDMRSRRTLGFVLGGVGVVGLGVGSYFGLRTLADKSDAARHCDASGTNCDPQGHSIGTEAKTFGWISTAAFGVGVVGVAAGVWLVLSSAPRRPTTALRLGPLPGGAGNGLRFDCAW